MIIGIGIDIASTLEFKRILADPATHFLAAHFTAGELAYARSHVSESVAQHLAARYAAKEAVIKALRNAPVRRRGSGGECGVRSGRPIDYTKIEVVNTADGAPQLRYHADVATLVAGKGVARSHLSLSHDGDMAVAMVVLEK